VPDHASSPHPHRAVVPPVPPGVARPRWSVMIPTYHCAEYLAQTLRSVLREDPGSDAMQIEVVDDHSVRDDPERVTCEVGGPRVSFFRQPKNVGHVQNFNTCLQRSRGTLVHLLHGDDAVREGFYATLGGAFAREPTIGAAFCRFIAMDEAGHWQTIAPLVASVAGVLPNWLEQIARGQRLQPPSIVVRRDAYERLGGFDDRIQSYGEDWEMWTRIAAHYPVWYEPEPLALYRLRAASLSRGAVSTGQNIRDLARAISINHELLPPDEADAISNFATVDTALTALRRSHRMLRAGDTHGPLVQLREALRLSRSPGVLAGSAGLVAHWALTHARHLLGRFGLRSPSRTSHS
jgi:glycosyltransferase involved in cell wall biosynthesis